MNDDLLDYLVATDSIDSFLGYEPKCPQCGNKLVEIVYGVPSSEIIEKVKKGELFLGKCMIDEVNPKYQCNTCERSYFENINNIDEYGNEYWYARELSKVLEYSDRRNFLKVLNKAKEACGNSGFKLDEQFVEINKLSKRTIMLLLIYKIINYQDICAI